MKTAASTTLVNFTAFDIAAVLVCLTCLVFMILRQRLDKPQSKVLLAIIIDVAITAASNAVANLVRTFFVANAASLAVVEFSGYVYFVTHTALGPLFVLYVIAVCGVGGVQNRTRNILIGIPFFVVELIALTNPLTHWAYSYGPDLSFSRGWGVYVFYVVGVLYLILGLAQLFVRWRALTTIKRRALIYFFLMVGTGVAVQLLVPAICVELFAESLAVLGVMMFVENEDEMLDSETGVYNRQALKLDLDAYVGRGKPFYVVAVRVSSADASNRVGRSILTANDLAIMLADYFKSLVPRYRVYRTAPARFVIVDPSMDAQRASELAQGIARRFGKSWLHSDTDVELHAVVALACVPDDLPTSDDVFYLVDTPVPPVADGVVLQGEGLNYLVRRAEVERAVQRGFDEGSYEVYFQPVMRADGTVYAAEALMRLNDSVLGNVPPIEFIEVAERLALVEGIGEIALRQVCEFFKSGVPQRLGIKGINVNLSVIECMQTDFAEHVKNVINEYGVDANLIGFEITESVAAGDYDFLDHVMMQLKGDGHRFAMDDFGTGYSNMHSLLSLDFDVVKIDKSVLWDAEKSATGMAVLEHSVGLLRNTGCKVLVEGVETEGQLQLLQSLGVDFFQGFYFAKPMAKADFEAYLEKSRNK